MSESKDQMRIGANSDATSIQRRQEAIGDVLSESGKSMIKSRSKVPNPPDTPCERQTGTCYERLQNSSDAKACDEVHDTEG